MMVGWHFGRSWSGTPLEDECPCEKAPCGLVANTSPDCMEHPPERMKTIRQGHRAEDCPGERR